MRRNMGNGDQQDVETDSIWEGEGGIEAHFRGRGECWYNYVTQHKRWV